MYTYELSLTVENVSVFLLVVSKNDKTNNNKKCQGGRTYSDSSFQTVVTGEARGRRGGGKGKLSS